MALKLGYVTRCLLNISNFPACRALEVVWVTAARPTNELSTEKTTHASRRHGLPGVEVQTVSQRTV